MISDMKTRTLPLSRYEMLGLSRFPNFHKTGSIKGIRNLCCGKNALLVRCGSFIYDVSSDPYIYFNEAQ